MLLLDVVTINIRIYILQIYINKMLPVNDQYSGKLPWEGWGTQVSGHHHPQRA